MRLYCIILPFILDVIHCQNPPEYDHDIGLPTTSPLNIAHRGSSGMLPENTRESFVLAIDQGADMIEVDLCVTKDLQLVTLHESWFGATTNAEEVFPEERKNTYFVQGRSITDFFTVDFTLEELKEIRVRQRMSYRDPNYNDDFMVATVEELIQTVQSSNRTVGMMLELKDPSWVNRLDIVQDAGTTFEDLLVDLLHSYEYTDSNQPAILQSFDFTTTRYLANITSLPISFVGATPMSDSMLQSLAEYCYGFTAAKRLIITANAQDQITGVTDLVQRARSFGLRVHAWTMRNEDHHLAWDYGQDPTLEYADFILDGLVDGIITDFPATMSRYVSVLYG